jgi:hypothetical protein
MCLLRHLKVVGNVAKDSGTEADLWTTDHGNGIRMWVLLPSLCSLSVAAAGRKFSIVIVTHARLMSHLVATEMQSMHVVGEAGSQKIVRSTRLKLGNVEVTRVLCPSHLRIRF